MTNQSSNINLEPGNLYWLNRKRQCYVAGTGRTSFTTKLDFFLDGSDVRREVSDWFIPINVWESSFYHGELEATVLCKHRIVDILCFYNNNVFRNEP